MASFCSLAIIIYTDIFILDLEFKKIWWMVYLLKFVRVSCIRETQESLCTSSCCQDFKGNQPCFFYEAVLVWIRGGFCTTYQGSKGEKKLKEFWLVLFYDVFNSCSSFFFFGYYKREERSVSWFFLDIIKCLYKE